MPNATHLDITCAIQVSSTESKLATLYEYVDDTEVRMGL